MSTTIETELELKEEAIAVLTPVINVSDLNSSGRLASVPGTA